MAAQGERRNSAPCPVSRAAFKPTCARLTLLRYDTLVSLGRRKIGIDDTSAWVFNRMAEVYAARPAYPSELVDALAELPGSDGRRVADIGAGIGHLALPLAKRGFEVVAVEPALQMLDVLRATATRSGISPRLVHAAAERLPLESDSLDLVVIADAVHFLDKELAAYEIARVLARRAALAIVTSEFGDTPFMQRVLEIMEDCAPRRPRDVSQAVAQFMAIARVNVTRERHILDETPVDAATLERILRSISFIGPAMNPERFATFMSRVQAVSARPVWARKFTLYSGRRGKFPA